MQALSVPRSVATLLANRNKGDAESAKSFLEPKISDLGEPLQLPDIKKVLKRIKTALEKKNASWSGVIMMWMELLPPLYSTIFLSSAWILNLKFLFPIA
jgi:hypothetical protein